MDAGLVYVVGLLFLGVVLFAVGRVFLLWYWKVDTQIELLQDIRNALVTMERAGRAITPAPGAPAGFDQFTPTPPAARPHLAPLSWEPPPPPGHPQD
jgi:hypothetical protein